MTWNAVWGLFNVHQTGPNLVQLQAVVFADDGLLEVLVEHLAMGSPVRGIRHTNNTKVEAQSGNEEAQST